MDTSSRPESKTGQTLASEREALLESLQEVEASGKGDNDTRDCLRKVGIYLQKLGQLWEQADDPSQAKARKDLYGETLSGLCKTITK